MTGALVCAVVGTGAGFTAGRLVRAWRRAWAATSPAGVQRALDEIGVRRADPEALAALDRELDCDGDVRAMLATMPDRTVPGFRQAGPGERS